MTNGSLTREPSPDVTKSRRHAAPVLVRRFTVSAPVETVRELLTDLTRLPEISEVGRVKNATAARIEAGVRWRNRGATLKLPSWDASIATEVTPNHIAWHTRSLVLGLIPVGADWSQSLESRPAGTLVTATFERVTMFGIPVAPLIKTPFLPMLYCARGAMMAGEKKLIRVLSAN